MRAACVMTLLVCGLSMSQAMLQFTNFKCIIHDPTFIQIPRCQIKAVNRTHKYITAVYHLLKLPVTNVLCNFELRKRANGYKPFLYNFTIDACRFLKNPKNLLTRFFYEMFRDYSNMNHTCPYNHDIFLDHLPVEHIGRIYKRLPFPTGDYAISFTYIIDGKKRTTSIAYLTLT